MFSEETGVECFPHRDLRLGSGYSFLLFAHGTFQMQLADHARLLPLLSSLPQPTRFQAEPPRLCLLSAPES